MPRKAVKDERVLNEGYEMVRVDTLKIHPRNPRRGDVTLIRELIRENGFHGAILVQRGTRHVLKGNHTLMAARDEGMKMIPVIWTDIDDERARKILLSDNRASDVGGYDPALLAGLLRDASDVDALAGTGYNDKDLAALLRKVAPPLDFPEYGADVETSHRCPKCGYEWS